MPRKIKSAEQLPLMPGLSASSPEKCAPGTDDSGESCVNPSVPSPEIWKQLYELAKEIKLLAPWNWISEDELFALVDPGSGERCYCSILGELGRYFAITLYLGDQGLSSFLDIQEQLHDPFELYVNQKCLALSFEDREAISPKERKLFKTLGLTFRGRKQYPSFRFHEPGFEPCVLDAEQAGLLLLLLPRIIAVALEAKEHSDFFLNEEGNIRCYTPVGEGDGWRWEEAWVEVVEPDVQILVPQLDELELRRFVKEFGRGESVIELDYFYFPASLRDAHKPYYPRAIMIADIRGPILTLELIESGEIAENLLRQFAQVVTRLGEIPRTIHVLRQDLAAIFNAYAGSFGYTVKIVEELPALDQARQHMAETL